MKNIILIPLFLPILLSSCSRRNDIEFNSSIDYEEFLSETNEQNNKMFVNAPDGLRVRDFPSINAEQIGILDNLTEVIVIREDEMMVSIGGIQGQWTFIESGNIQGWVFGGFLSSKPLDAVEQSLFFRNPEIRKNTMEDIKYFFNNYFNIRELRSAENLEEFMVIFGVLEENVNISRITWDEPWGFGGGLMYNQTTIESGLYRLIIFNEVWFYGLEIQLSEYNFLDLFPHRTLEAFLSDDDFGSRLFQRQSGIIVLSQTEWDEWFLLFNDGLLYSIAFYRYVN